nr:hypothetical protein [Mycobacterium sp.]
MEQLDFIANIAANMLEQFYGVADVLVGAEVVAGRGVRRCVQITRPAAVSAPLDADMPHLLIHPLADILPDFFEGSTAGMAVDCCRLTALSAKKIVDRHLRHLALNIPKRHVDAEMALFSTGPLRQ